MEYTVQKLSKLAGVTTRTLRYYDEIGILKPARINSSGYRIYGQAEVDHLQQIMFYRELGVSLDIIRGIVTSSVFNSVQVLAEHKQQLQDRRNQLDQLITTIDRTIAAHGGGPKMHDAEKFEGFKQQLIDDNEQKYGQEIREKYGDQAVNESNQRVMNMTQAQNEEVTRLGEEVQVTLAAAIEAGDPSSPLAQKVAALHKKWLMFYWSEYSSEAHAGLAQMYVDDERFRAYYDEKRPGTAEFLRDAIHIFTKNS